MNAVIENMISRRSVKAYKPDMVPMELIEEVVKAECAPDAEEE